MPTSTSLIEWMTRLEKEAEDFGFAWPDVDSIIAQLQDECREIQEAVQAGESSARIQEEIGDLLHAAFSLCVFMKFSPEETLEKTTTKFAERFYRVKEIAQAEGYEDLKGQSFEVLMQFWRRAKG